MTPPINRRSFLSMSILGAAGAASPSRLAEAKGPGVRRGVSQTAPGRSFDPWIEVHEAHLAHNVAQVARHAGGRPVLAVVKNNGYGLGVVHAGRALAQVPGVRGLAVITLGEALALREAGVTAPILLMGPFDERDLADMQARDIMPMVYTPVGATLERVAAASGRPMRIHVCVDTGLGRVGVPFRDAAALVRDLAGRRGVTLDGIMMTFSEDAAFDQQQLRRFETLTGELTAAGIGLGLRHAASSYTLFQHENAWLEMVRPGMALYGIYPEPGFRGARPIDLRPALAFRVRVAYVKKLPAGDSAGYNRAYVATDDTWIATLPVGHADGWPRVAAKGARVRIGESTYPVIASVSASHTLLEIGRDPRVQIGDVATLFDWEEGSRPEDVAVACGASVYDLTMHLGGHLRRVMA